ncbi:hypothetical protein WME98_50100 [Sorangium sp. So ce296]|uniref:hypothetical protein n=1 Tax=Sorangium sp. So ce296 TaxID=3133296 RepID=UPI003F5F0A02
MPEETTRPAPPKGAVLRALAASVTATIAIRAAIALAGVAKRAAAIANRAAAIADDAIAMVDRASGLDAAASPATSTPAGRTARAA